MKNIEVAVIDQMGNPGGTMLFLASLTQSGHKVKCMNDLFNLYVKANGKAYDGNAAMARIAALPHGTIKRFSPITIAVVGASRRFLAQARTHQVGFNYVSASLQYSDYSGSTDDQFVIPYAIMQQEVEWSKSFSKPTEEQIRGASPVHHFLSTCANAMKAYGIIAKDTDNDTAGYVAPQSLRNVLIMQANHEAWAYFVGLRACNRNTVETQYVALKIWEALLQTENGKELFKYMGPNCCTGRCREGNMSCLKKGGSVLHNLPADEYMMKHNVSLPTAIIATKFPLLTKEGE